MKIGIRADGGMGIGMGHIMRTLVLAKELSKTEEVFYICKSNTEYISGVNRIKEEGFKVELVNENNIVDNLKNIYCDLLITDSYDVNELYFNDTKNIFNKTVYIDDINLLDFYNVDVLINQNIGAEKFEYNVPGESELLLGADYIMLRNEFRNYKNKEINRNVKNIFISLGGADPYNITSLLLNSLTPLDYHYHVIVGPSFENIYKLNGIELKNSNVSLYINANMSEVMKNCDLAVSACGSTLYELAALNIPTLGIIIADNQKYIAEEMDKNFMIKNLGWYNNLTEDAVAMEVVSLSNNYELRKKMCCKQQGINKNGVEKLALKLLNPI